MSIRFPRSCKTRAQRSALASLVARRRWEVVRAGRPEPVWIGGIAFDGPLVAGKAMRLDLYAVDGERKWTARGDGVLIQDRLSERGVLRIVRAVLRAPRV